MLLLRVLTRSGGMAVTALVLLGMAFYGIALLSVMVVDDPARGLKVLGVFLALAVAFLALARWALRQALQQALRPLDAAKEATARLASLGGQGGREAFRAFRLGAGVLGAWAAAKVVRAAARAASFISRRGGASPAPPSGRQAPVIPLRRGGQDRKAR